MVNNVTSSWIVANIIAIADGTPQIANPAHPFDVTDQTRAFEDRWGGWYVTGTSGKQTHLGNRTFTGRASTGPVAQPSRTACRQSVRAILR